MADRRRGSDQQPETGVLLGPNLPGRHRRSPDLGRTLFRRLLPRPGSSLGQARRSARTGIVRMPAVLSAYSAKPGYRRACSAKTRSRSSPVMHQCERRALERAAHSAFVRPELGDDLRVPVVRLGHVPLSPILEAPRSLLGQQGTGASTSDGLSTGLSTLSPPSASAWVARICREPSVPGERTAGRRHTGAAMLQRRQPPLRLSPEVQGLALRRSGCARRRRAFPAHRLDVGGRRIGRQVPAKTRARCEDGVGPAPHRRRHRRLRDHVTTQLGGRRLASPD